jgi:hypothetical protein
MVRRSIVWFLFLIGVLGVVSVLEAQGSLSQQVLQLLTRTNSWTGQNTFYNFRMSTGSIPGDTANRIYQDPSHNLYFNGGLIAGAGGGVTPHNLLSSTHPDTLVASPTRGAIVVANSSPVWARVQPSVTGSFLTFNGTDTVFATDGSGLTVLTSSSLVGALPALNGGALTNLNASALASGTVALARISGITNTQIDAAAAIAYSKLNLVGLVNLSSDTAATALPFAKGGTGLTAAADDTIPVSSGAAWVAKAIPNCVDATHSLAYTTATNAFSCQALTVGSGTVTSVAASVPSILTIGGSPITTSGTLAISLASQSQNLMFASPNGSAGTPTFRAIVNADIPLSGVSAGTYPSVTVNTRGFVTGATTTVDLTTVGGATILAKANGGTGISTSGDDTTIVGSGAAWVQTALPNCTQFWSYSTTTNLFTCAATWASGTIVVSAPAAITATWNAGGVNFNQFDINVTDSASTAVSTLETLRVGGTTQWSVRKDGVAFQVGIAFASLGTPTNGTMTYCNNCTPASTPCTGGSTGAYAFRRNGAWACF